METGPVQRETDSGPRAAPRRRPRPQPRRGRSWILLAVWALVVAVVFVVGLAVGRALEDSPAPGGTQTLVRTLKPSTVGPAVTVTVKAQTSAP